MKLKTLARAAVAERAAIDAESNTIDLSFSSEEPVARWFGTEVLDHAPGAADLSRLKSGAPLLFNHDRNDVVGVVEDASIGPNRRGYARVRFARTARGEEVRALVEDNILRNVSFAYQIDEMREDKKTDTFTATKWTPLEISIVTVPADPSVGIGRAEGDVEREVRVLRAEDEPARTAETLKEVKLTQAADAPAGATADNQAARSALSMEDDRKVAIENLCKANKIDDGIRNMWITSGASLRQVSDDLMAILLKRSETAAPVTELGLSQRETKRFSLTRAIAACGTGNWHEAGFEAECSREIGKRLGRHLDGQRFFVPWEVQTDQAIARRDLEGRRDLTVGTASAGGYLVQTDNVGFVELLRANSVLYGAGATRMPGLQGSVAIPKQSAAATAYWLANEAATITESQQTFTQITMTPKTVGGYTEISRQLLLQASPAAEGLVRADLAKVVALDIDAKALNGSGASGQPLGLIGTAGVGAVAGTSIAYAGIVEFQTDVFTSNALFDGSTYLATGVVAGLLKQRVKFTSTASPLWEGKLTDGMVDGYRAMASNQVPTGYLIFGDFSQIVIGEWGVLEIEVNPYAGFTAGIIGVRALASIDVAVRYPTAFSIATTVT